jgi:hypothetical protein
VVESGPSLPLRFRVLNTVGKHLGAIRLPFAALDEEALEEAAMKATGLTEFGNDYHLEGLLRLLEPVENDAALRQNPRSKHGAHLYAPENFGQTRDTISRRFAAYIERIELASPNGTHQNSRQR